MSIEGPPDAYLRYCARLVCQGLDPPLLLSASEAEPSNVHSIEAARTRKCIEICRRRGDFGERPL
jgi:hypothetical protein